MSEDRVEMRCVIEGPRDAVFRAWTDPEELKQWWGPGEFTCPEADVDLRPGGRYRLVMQGKAGDPLVLGGTYREVDPPRRLVYSWRWEAGVPGGEESTVIVEFRDLGERTEVVLVHTDFPPSHGPAPYQMGWEGGFEKLAALFAERSVV